VMDGCKNIRDEMFNRSLDIGMFERFQKRGQSRSSGHGGGHYDCSPVSSSRKNLLGEMSLMTQMLKDPFFRLRLPGRTLVIGIEIDAFRDG
jgi:hypothetical protein